MKDIMIDIYSTMLSDENKLLNGAMTAEEYQEMKSAKDLYNDTEKDYLIQREEPSRKKLQIDYGLIGELEGNVLEANVPDPEGSKSGVTVGIGVDLGEKNREYFAGFENQELLDKFDQYYGLQGMEAYKYEQQNELKITQEEADALNAFIKGKTTQTLRSNFEKTFGMDLADLPPELQTVVASVGYQYGPSFMIDNPKTKEYDPSTPAFASLLDLLSKNPGNVARYEEIVEELRDFGDRYKTRRKKEADYLQTYIDRVKK
jgi:hypothetical protein